MRVIVCGGRTYSDRQKMCDELAKLPHDTVIVCGGARGADELAHDEGIALGLVVEIFFAEWYTHGKAAGPIRNQRMLDSGIDQVIAFPGGYGTGDMKRRARESGVPVREISS